jgi:hypothetical protein
MYNRESTVIHIVVGGFEIHDVAIRAGFLHERKFLRFLLKNKTKSRGIFPVIVKKSNNKILVLIVCRLLACSPDCLLNFFIQRQLAIVSTNLT